MWRYDAYRSASAPHDIGDELQLVWTRQYGQRQQVWDDPLNHDLMPYDKVLEPVVLDNRLFLGFNDRDKVIALDIESGRQLWEFFTEGPVRLPPVAWQAKVYFTSDDGCIYCVRADNGELIWKFRGGPSERKVIGNRRIISAWPARGGPVIRDGHLYFAASIWPFMGTFIYSLNADTGEVVWVNDSTGVQYIRQPHGAPAFAGVAPQGSLVATEKVLLVPGGRSVPAAFDRQNGKFLNFHIGGKGTGGSFVCADEKRLYIHTRQRGVRVGDLKKGDISNRVINEPVLYEGGTISYDGAHLRASTKSLDFKVEVDASGDLIKAGSRIIAAGKDAITALDTAGEVIWSKPVDGDVLRLLAGGEKLIAVTLDGRILVYGQSDSVEEIPQTDQVPQPSPETIRQARELVQGADANEGYALWFGAGDGRLLHAVLSQSKLHVAAVDLDSKKVDRLRGQFDAAGLYGHRISMHVNDPFSFDAPPYIANLIVVDAALVSQVVTEKGIRKIYESVRPYGGALWISCDRPQKERINDILAAAKLPKARIDDSGQGIFVFREGPLPGAADWTHQYGDVANTVKSQDRRVRLPLGVLWFGGNSNLDILPRHGHGPPEQVIGGRTFVEGMDSISAWDTYTGRVLWKRTFDNLGNFGVYFDETYKNTPLSTQYNQVHIPGANGRGTNYVATEKELYVAIGSGCSVLDAKTGETVRRIEMPPITPGEAAPLWGFIGVYEDILLGGWGFANYTGKETDHSSREGLNILDLSASNGLVAFDRHSGEVLWHVKSRYSFIHNGTVAGGGRVYCLDKLPKSIEADHRRRGLIDEPAYRIVALDASSGDLLWEHTENIFGTWLSYSEPQDILLQAGARGSDRLRDEVGQGMAAYQAEDGRTLWQELERVYSGPCILHDDALLTNVNSYDKSAGAFKLLDGSPHMVKNPITGATEPWRVTRTYGCNSMIASENLLTFRSGAAGFYDLERRSGTGNFGGFRSGCSSNLVVAGGVLNAPDYTRTCTCTYQNQTSLALVHMPDVELWTNSTYQTDGRIERVGINFGAPGDRLSSTGTMWLDYPSVGGDSPRVNVNVRGSNTTYFRRHSTVVRDDSHPWVTASGAENLESVTIRLFQSPSKREGLGERIPIAADHDDAEERTDGSMYLGSSDLELAEDGSPQLVGMRFADVPIEQGDDFASAEIQFTTKGLGRDPVELEIRAELSSDAESFSSDTYDISERASTKASVSWSPPAWERIGEAGPAQRTPNLAELVHEVTRQPDWKPGNAIVFIVSGKGQRTARSARDDAAVGPQLIIKTSQQLAAEQAEAAREASANKAQASLWTVRLYFAEPADVAPGERLFDIALQEKIVLQDFDVVKQAGGRQQGIVMEFPHVSALDALRIDLRSPAGQQAGTLLSGVELVAED